MGQLLQRLKYCDKPRNAIEDRIKPLGKKTLRSAFYPLRVGVKRTVRHHLCRQEKTLNKANKNYRKIFQVKRRHSSGE